MPQGLSLVVHVRGARRGVRLVVEQFAVRNRIRRRKGSWTLLLQPTAAETAKASCPCSSETLTEKSALCPAPRNQGAGRGLNFFCFPEIRVSLLCKPQLYCLSFHSRTPTTSFSLLPSRNGAIFIATGFASPLIMRRNCALKLPLS